MDSIYKFSVHKNRQIRLIIDSDAKCEADDQYAIVHALLTPKFVVKGIIAAHFGAAATRNTMLESYQEINHILELMQLKDKVAAYKGAEKALISETVAEASPGAELIIKEAMREDDLPLYVIVQGPITNVASAYLLEPNIASRMTVIWMGGGPYPVGGRETNLKNDLHAANVVFKSKIKLWQIPTPAFALMKVSLAELQYKVSPCGAVGRYLFEQLVACDRQHSASASRGWPKGESWVLGDSAAIGVLLDPHNHYFTTQSAPSFSPEMEYIHEQGNRHIRIYSYIDSRFVLEDFFCKLALNYGK